MYKPKFFGKKETATTSFDTSYNTNPKNKTAYEARNIRRDNPEVSYKAAYDRAEKGEQGTPWKYASKSKY